MCTKIIVNLFGDTAEPFKGKLIQVNSNGQILLGINEYVDGSFSLPNCHDGTFYTPLNPFGSPLQVIISCDNSPLSYSMFVLLFPNEDILNVGFECRETDYNCQNSFLTFLIYKRDFSSFVLPKKQVYVDTDNVISDAIISLDSQNIYFLAYPYSGNPSMIRIFCFEISFLKGYINSNSNINSPTNPYGVQEIAFAYYCGTINEYTSDLFVLLCFSNDDYANQILSTSSKYIQLIYLIQKVNNEFKTIYYFDIYSKNFYGLTSILNKDGRILVALSKFEFFSYIFINKDLIQKSQYDFTLENKVIVINSVRIFPDSIFFFGCIYDKNQLDLKYSQTSLIYISTYTNQQLKIINFTEYPHSCIVGEVVKNEQQSIISISVFESSDQYSVVLYDISESGDKLRNILINKVSYEKIPLAINSKNELIAVATLKNPTSNMQSPVAFSFDLNLNLITQRKYEGLANVLTNTILLNINDALSFGGISISKKVKIFWIGNINGINNERVDSFYGTNEGAAISSSCISKRIQTYSGYIVKDTIKIHSLYSNFVSGYVVFQTDYGKFIEYMSYTNDICKSMMNSIKVENSSILLFSLLSDSKLYSYNVTSNIQCPSDTPNIDKFECGCFASCLKFQHTETDSLFQQCIPNGEGCDSFGYLIDKYKCFNGKIIKNISMPSIDHPHFTSTMISTSTVEIKFNQTIFID